MSENEPVAAALGSTPVLGAGVSDQERARLHSALDALLDQRQSWDAINGNSFGGSVLGGHAGLPTYTNLAENASGEDAREIVKDGAKLLRDALGTALRSAAFQRPIRDEDGGKRVLSEWLRLVEPLLETPSSFGSAPDQYLRLYEVFIGLSALSAGEVQPLFQPGDRGKKPANSYSLAWAKLRALEWKETLGALGYKDGDANNIISQAFGEQWDTIRKWRQSCGSVLDDITVAYCLEKARDVCRYQSQSPSRLFGGLRTPEEDLKLAGTRYRDERRRSAEASKTKRARKVAPASFPER